jgi:hypothetical protein
MDRSWWSRRRRRRLYAAGARGTRCLAGRSLGRVPALGVARQTVVWDRLPCSGVGGELAHARLDLRIALEGSETDAHLSWVVRVPAEERRAAFSAEPLLPAARRLPCAQALLAGKNSKRPGLGAAVCGGGGAATPLAARAVAVVRGLQRDGYLEAGPLHSRIRRAEASQAGEPWDHDTYEACFANSSGSARVGGWRLVSGSTPRHRVPYRLCPPWLPSSSSTSCHRRIRA